jgi:transcriptional regulator with XRE-family HTH domain
VSIDVDKLAVHDAYMARVARVLPKIHRRSTFIREWRKSKKLSLVTLADRIGVSHATLSRIERGKQDYNQTLLELLAEEFNTDPVSLLIRNPMDPDAIWSVWDQAKPGQRRQIIEIARTLLKTAN